MNKNFYIIDGVNKISVDEDEFVCYDGQYIYLVGSSGIYSFIALDYTYVSNPTAFDNFDFVTLIAYLTSDVDGEKVVQVQFGDIVSPLKNFVSSISGDTASIGIEGSIDEVKIISENGVYIRGGTTNEIIIGSTASLEYDGEFAFHVESNSGTTLNVTATVTTASGTYTSAVKTVAVPAAE